MISYRFCNPDEKAMTRGLYEEAFSEDDKKFVDAFYHYEVPFNRVAAAFDENEIRAMMHLHPMRLQGYGSPIETAYLVAVATYWAYRKRGYYRQLLRWVLNELYQESMPFVLLMPADERIYFPFGFRTMFEMGRRRITKPGPVDFDFQQLHEVLAEDLNRMNAFTLGRLHIQRDEEWAARSIATFSAMRGGIVRVLQGDRVVGYLRYEKEDMLHVVDILAKPEDEERILRAFAAYHGTKALTFDMARVVGDEPTNVLVKYMYRIVHLAAFTALLRTDRTADWFLRVHDGQIAENNGTYHFYTEAGRVRMESVPATPCFEMVEIGDLLRRLATLCQPLESSFHEIV